MNSSFSFRAILHTAAAAAALALAAPATAYVGPGAGLSLLGALWAVVAAVLAALFFVAMWPIRRLMKRRAQATAQAAATPAPERTAPPRR